MIVFGVVFYSPGSHAFRVWYIFVSSVRLSDGCARLVRESGIISPIPSAVGVALPASTLVCRLISDLRPSLLGPILTPTAEPWGGGV